MSGGEDASGLLEAVRAWGREAIDLLLPRGCAGCDAPDETLCPSCRALFGDYRRWTLSGQGVPCFACADYRAAARAAILGWKDHDDVELDRVFAPCMADLVRASGVAGMLRAPDARVLVVPAPSSASSLRRRGRAHVRPLTDAVVAELTGEGVRVRSADALRVNGVRSKSVETRGIRGRMNRLDGRIGVSPRAGVAGATVLLVDDIVTTGATLSRCVDAIRTAGGRVAAVFALAHTPPPGRGVSGISAA